MSEQPVDRRVVECVPNFSEGRRPEVVAAIVEAIAQTPGVRILDHTSDHDHNRSVVTFVGPPEACTEGAFAGISRAADLIDMEAHCGGHPRIGAADVVPFVPIRGVTMAECVELARTLGKRVAEELGIPVYLYGEAATSPDRRNLADIRRGEYEGLKQTIDTPERHPDFGPPRLHPTAGATVIGARMPLIAFNVNLGTGDLEIARKIARAVRGSSGGLVHVRAIGVMLSERNIAQVSMNLVDYTRTPIHRAVEMVRREAQRYGVPIVETELIGLMPLDAILDSAAFYLQLPKLSSGQILEAKIWDED
ncbi:MAG: glutamate formimidoyltransferase [Firmicutes bacterium]|jgi:glutamate formiminotransferase|nr:glutamate formimidoyltransferase [Bacillota bacterium]